MISPCCPTSSSRTRLISPSQITGVTSTPPIGAISRRVKAAYKANFAWDPEVVRAVVERCREVDSGARNIDHVLSGTMLPDLSTRLLGRMAEGSPVERVEVGLHETGGFVFRID